MSTPKNLQHHQGKSATQGKKHNETFNQAMSHVQAQMHRSSRPVSRFIHRPMVEKLSNLAGQTIARPNAILAGGITAFLGVLAIYNYARFAGLSLQGSETLVTFAVGWAIGTVFDIVRRIVGRRGQS